MNSLYRLLPIPDRKKSLKRKITLLAFHMIFFRITTITEFIVQNKRSRQISPHKTTQLLEIIIRQSEL